MSKILVVGGVAGGASAATRLRRLDESAEIIVFERGPYISFANCGLPYHIGGVIKKRESLLVSTPENLHDEYNLDVRIMQECRKSLPSIATKKRSLSAWWKQARSIESLTRRRYPSNQSYHEHPNGHSVGRPRQSTR